MEVERENHPAGATAERIACAFELGFPGFVAAKRFLDRLQYIAGCLSVTAEIGEVDFVQRDRASADEFFAFEVAVDVCRQVLVCEHRSQALFDGVESAHSAAVVVLVMRTDELFRNPFEFGRIEGQCHDLMLPAKSGRSWCFRRGFSHSSQLDSCSCSDDGPYCFTSRKILHTLPLGNNR